MERTKIETELPIPTAEAARDSSSSTPHSPSPPPPWIELPEDVTANILKRLGAEEILESAQKVCSTWRKICKDPAMWRVLHLKNRHDGDDDAFVLMCESAVDYSQGQLIDISIANFEDYDLISYVADRSSHLRRLTLEDCEAPGTVLIEALKKLPELEELHLIKISAIDAKDLETIGITRPSLKSFTYNEHWCEFPEDTEGAEKYYVDDHAIAIGRNFPNLHHLRLFAHHRMENRGLEAILDGCPHLESLDLRQCSGLDLKGDLGKRMFEQIKDVRLPSESIRDYEWPPTEDDWEEEESSDDTMSSFYDSDYEDLDEGDYEQLDEESDDTMQPYSGSDYEDLEECNKWY